MDSCLEIKTLRIMPHETLNRLLEYVGLEVDNHYVPRNEFFRLSLSHCESKSLTGVGDNFVINICRQY